MFNADPDRDKTAETERENLPEADLNNLAQSDSLRLYLREISRIPLLCSKRGTPCRANRKRRQGCA